MTTPHRTLQMALDALEWLLANIRRNAPELSGKSMGNAEVAIAALREALAAPEPEPVARVAEVHMSRYTIEWTNGPLPEGTGLYAAPPAAPAPVVREPQDDLIESVIRDVAELDYSSPEGMPDVMLVTADELRGILQARLCEALAAPPAAPAPDGRVMAPREPTPEMLAVVRNGPMHETWTEGYCAMIAAAPAAPAAPVVPLTDSELTKIAVEDEFLLYCDQDSFNEIARAIEAAHGITGGKP